MQTYVDGESFSLSPVVPADLDDATVAYPCKVSHLMPTQEEVDQIPEKYLEPAVRLIATWFHIGLDESNTGWYPQPGIEMTKAIRHIRACMRTFETRHEDKVLGCAVLVVRFFDKIAYVSNASTQETRVAGLRYKDKPNG